MGFDGKMEVTTLEGQEQRFQGPVAAIVPIKQLGTNGGGYWCKLSHPLENPTPVQYGRMLVYPDYTDGNGFALGFIQTEKNRLYSIYGVMLLCLFGGCRHQCLSGDER